MPENFSAFDFTLILLAFAGLSLAALLSLLYARHSLKSAQDLKALAQENALTANELSQANGLLNSDQQVRLIYEGSGGIPRINGAIKELFPDILPHRLPSFSTWLRDEEATKIEAAMQRLRTSGQGFKLELVALSGKVFEAIGSVLGAAAILRLRLIEGVREDMRLKDQQLSDTKALLAQHEAILHLLPQPLWLRDKESKLMHVNAAYARAVEAPDAKTAQEKASELLDNTALTQIKYTIASNQPYKNALRAVAAGERRIYEVSETPFPWGSVGIALDITQSEALKKERGDEVKAQRRIFDKLGVALAIFDAERKLVFYNRACQDLWGLPASLLDDSPREGDIFDTLRNNGRLPEHPNYREWKRSFLELKADKDQEPREESWYMPDRSSLKVTQFQNELGGFTYLFDDVTQRHELERNYSALHLLQRETIENLSEAVAVYASDGRLSLSNEAFSKLWEVNDETRATRPHIEELNQLCKRDLVDSYPLDMLQGMVTGLQGSRETYSATLERKDGTIIALTASPMPDGGTLTTSRNITHEANAQKLLLERNNALQAANHLKSAFVHNVSYEMRTPLTNIIGFTQMLESGILGQLPPPQHEYLEFILRSSQQLENVIDSILDFAALETGALALDLGDFDIKTTMLAAIATVKGKRAQDKIKIVLEAPTRLGMMHGDERRVRQIFSHLLSNAIGFATTHGKVHFRVERTPTHFLFIIKDDGPGIAPEQRGQIFEAFTSFSAGTSHRGMGLGLSLARSLVELHGGKLDIPPHEGIGTVVTVLFPIQEEAHHAD